MRSALLLLRERINRQREYHGDATFWRAVDSGAGYTTFRGCYCGRREPGYCADCGTGWAKVRDERCLARKSDRTRCTGSTVDGTPFCSFHLTRAEDWFLARLTAAQQRNLEWDLRTRYRITEAEFQMAAHFASSARSGGSRVYFYELEGQGLVKIGTSVQVEQRVAQFRNGTGCTFPPDCDPSAGRLIGHISGDRIVERALHDEFRPLRVVGEWFRLTDDLATSIAELIAADEAHRAQAQPA